MRILGGEEARGTGSGAPRPRDPSAGFVVPDVDFAIKGEQLLALTAQVSVLPSEVVAVVGATRPGVPSQSHVYLRGGGGAYIVVPRSLAEVTRLLERARTAGSDPAP